MIVSKRGSIYNFIQNSQMFMAILCFGSIFGFCFLIAWSGLVLVEGIAFISLWWLRTIMVISLIISLVWFKLSLPFSNTKRDKLFKIFDTKHPEVYLAFKKFASELRVSGTKRIDIGKIKSKINQEIMPTIDASLLLSTSNANRYANKLMAENENYRKLLSFNKCCMKRKRKKLKTSTCSSICGPRRRYYNGIFLSGYYYD